MSTSLSSAVRDADICSLSLSDHDGNLCRLSLIPRPSRATRWRFNPKLLQDEKFCSQFRNKFAEFIEINQGSVVNPILLAIVYIYICVYVCVCFRLHLMHTNLRCFQRCSGGVGSGLPPQKHAPISYKLLWLLAWHP